jgi:outer membrane protein assembly factor BamB
VTSVSTTISCRFFAQSTALILILSVTVAAAGQPPQPVPQLPSPQPQPVPPLPTQPQPFPQPPESKPASEQPAQPKPRQRRDQPPPQPVPGAERWSKAIGAATSVPPVINDRQVFAVVPPASVASFGLADGVEIWRVELTPEHPLAFHDGRLFVASGDAMHALDATTGAVVWREPTGALAATPLVREGWVITAAGGEVVARRATDGTVVWRQPHGPLQVRPTIEGDRLFLPLADSRIVAVDLTTGAPQWERKLGGAPSEVEALAGRLYVGSADKYFYCLDADNGETEWRHRVGAVVIGRPAVDAERLYLATTDNLVRAFDRVDGARKWQAALPFRPYAGPLLFGTAVVVPGSVAELQTFDVSTGKTGRPMTFGAPLAGPLSIQASDKGPLAATITGGLSGEWKLSLWEPLMSIPAAPLTVLPGQPVPLPAAPAPGAGAR